MTPYDIYYALKDLHREAPFISQGEYRDRERALVEAALKGRKL